MKAHFEMMAAYNQWANDRIYAAASGLSEEDLRRDVGAFFHSMHGTLNHLYVTDVIWMSRFRGLPNPPWTLDHIAHGPLTELAARRKLLDRDIRGYVLSLSDADLEEEFTYSRVTDPAPVTQILREALAHFFNHQTHHRGQAHAILSVTGHAPPPLDLLHFQRGL